MKSFWLSLSFLMGSVCCLSKEPCTNSPKKTVEFFIVVPSYNNNRSDEAGGNWVERCLQSVFSQKNHHWTLTYINDASTDGTGRAAEDFAKRCGMQSKCTFIHNETNRGALANLYDVISQCPPKKVVVLLDGDDELTHAHVLDRVAREYTRRDAWLTYGSYVQWPGGNHGCAAAIPQRICAAGGFVRCGFARPTFAPSEQSSFRRSMRKT